MRKFKIIVIGGGMGILVILKSFCLEDVEIIVVVMVVDDGGLLGELCLVM